MSHRIGRLIVIAPMAEAKCEACGKMEELRPYGPGGSCVCYECAMKTPEIADHNMAIQLFGAEGEIK